MEPTFIQVSMWVKVLLCLMNGTLLSPHIFRRRLSTSHALLLTVVSRVIKDIVMLLVLVFSKTVRLMTDLTT